MRENRAMHSATEIFEELDSVDESTRIEAKRASELGKSVMQTVIAFANEPGLEGGYLLLGAAWFINDKGDTVYRAVGLPDPDKVQRDLVSLCAPMLNVALRPQMQTEAVDGRTVLVVYIPEADVTQKPVYLKATGLPRGAYRRVGSTDRHCVDEDLWALRDESQPPNAPTHADTLRSRSVEYATRTEEGCNFELATLLGKDRKYSRNKHLIPMVRDGELRFRYPESAKHPHQAYVTAKAGDL